MSDDGLKEAHGALIRRVMGKAGIAGTAIGERNGKPCLKVYLSADEGSRHVPDRLKGFPVITEKTGSFEAGG